MQIKSLERKELIMKIIVFGGAGLLGSAITRELRSHGHQVVTAGRSGCDVKVDFRYDLERTVYATVVRGADIVVNAVGLLIERGDERFDTVHVAAPRALFEACAQEHVARVVHISALGAGRGIKGRYMASKDAVEVALAQAMQQASGDWAIVRPSLLMDARSPSTRLFMQLARWPLMGLPGFMRSHARLAPMHCEDAARAIVRICEHAKGLRRVIEIAGPQEFSYREFLQTLRVAQGLRAARLWPVPIPLPWMLMHLLARIAEHLPQKVLSSDGLHVLRAGITTEHNEAMYWLRQMPRAITKLGNSGDSSNGADHTALPAPKPTSTPTSLA
jgi:nucleoside-diphosphate-sugar epimerase